MQRNILFKHGQRIGTFVNRSFSTSFRAEFTGIPDKELQVSFEGFLPRLSPISSLLTNKIGFQDKYTKMITDGIISPSNSILNSLLVFSDVHNPLLLKYGFDAEEFLLGAKEAITQVHLAMASKEFSHFSNNNIAESDSAVLLEGAFSERLYNACLKASKQLNIDGAVIFMDDIHVSKTIINSISTNIMDDDSLGREYGTLHGEKSNITNTPLVCNLYPADSVVATVDVYYEAEESHHKTSSESDLHRSSKAIWTFEGCISGHEELEWKIVALNGLGRG